MGHDGGGFGGWAHIPPLTETQICKGTKKNHQRPAVPVVESSNVGRKFKVAGKGHPSSKDRLTSSPAAAGVAADHPTPIGGSLLSLEVEALIEIGVKVRCTGHAEGRNSSLVPRDHGACARNLGLGDSVMLVPWLKSRFNESLAKTHGRKYCLAYRRFRARLTGQPER